MSRNKSNVSSALVDRARILGEIRDPSRLTLAPLGTALFFGDDDEPFELRTAGADLLAASGRREGGGIVFKIR
jgi:hypothetical protein